MRREKREQDWARVRAWPSPCPQRAQKGAQARRNVLKRGWGFREHGRRESVTSWVMSTLWAELALMDEANPEPYDDARVVYREIEMGMDMYVAGSNGVHAGLPYLSAVGSNTSGGRTGGRARPLPCSFPAKPHVLDRGVCVDGEVRAG